ncbi:hypothetical protein HQ587_02025 [bacterium]|nr:hypothetical protein [bacterium]
MSKVINTKTISIFITILIPALVIIGGCGDSIPDMPTPVPNTGSIVVTGYVQPAPDSTVYTDSIGVILDGDSLGFHVNPCTIDNIPVGFHDIKVYFFLSGEIVSGRARSIEVLFAGTADVRIRMAAGGVVVVSADYDGQTQDSLGVRLDGTDLGIDIAPRVIPNISEGLHKLVAYSTDDTTNLEAWQGDVEVVRAETTKIDLTLQMVAPFVGSHAPNIDCIDIDGNSYSLFDHWGEVIYLYFFEHT